MKKTNKKKAFETNNKNKTTKKSQFENEQNKKLCKGCDLCCKYVNFGIDVPNNPKAHDEVIWFIMHKNVYVWIDKHNNWFFKFVTPCEHIKNGLCNIYGKRPHMCREYSHRECERYNPEKDEMFAFHTPEEFIYYLKQCRVKYKGNYK
jgi:Fe-S-cluster containining protein